MINQKIPTLFGIIIFVIIAVTVFSFVWLYEKNLSIIVDTNQSQMMSEAQNNPVMQTSIDAQQEEQLIVAPEEFPTIQIQQGVSLEEIIKQAIYKNVPDWKIKNYDIKVVVETNEKNHAIGKFFYDGYNIVKDGKYRNTVEGIWFAAKSDNGWTLTNISYVGYNGSCQIFKRFNFPLNLTPDCWDYEKNIQIETKNPKRFYQNGITGRDKEEIEQAFVSYIKNKNAYSEFYLNKNLFVLIIKNTETYLKGMVLVGGMENRSTPSFFAAKVSGKWKVIFNGQDYPLCSVVDSYHFPQQILPWCYDDQAKQERAPL